MNCKRIQEFLLTNYIDGEIAPALKRQVQEHISACAQCRQFEQAVRKTTIEPFRKAKEQKPPDYLWARIKEAVFKEKPQQHLFYIPRPAFALATAVAAVLIAIIFTRLPFENQKIVNGYLEEQMIFISYLDSDESDFYNQDYIDLGTSIEEYFF